MLLNAEMFRGSPLFQVRLKLPQLPWLQPMGNFQLYESSHIYRKPEGKSKKLDDTLIISNQAKHSEDSKPRVIFLTRE